MQGKNDKDHKIICNYQGVGKESRSLQIQVTDANGAQGQSSQPFTLDSNAPVITIEPNQTISSGNIELTITLTDENKLDQSSININDQPFDVNQCSVKEDSKLVCPYTITGPTQDEKIKVSIRDQAGHETTTES